MRLLLSKNKKNRHKCIVGVVYLIVNKVTGHVYVGQTFNPKPRISQHFYKLRYGNHYSKTMQSDFDKFGEESFKVNIYTSESATKGYCLEFVIKREILVKKESELIHVLKPKYNRNHFKGLRNKYKERNRVFYG